MWCPVGGSVVGCGALAVSRKTPFFFINFFRDMISNIGKSNDLVNCLYSEMKVIN